MIGGFTSFSGVSSDLVAPYEYLLNFSYARPLPKKMTIEVGYIGRLSHKGLMQQDFAQPMTLFKDVKSGQTWPQASTLLKRIYDSGVTPAQVQANPNLIPQIAFFENIFPGAKNYKFNGSASANYYYTVYGTYAGSDLDALNDMDRLRQPNGTCISVYGCNTFFANQAAGLSAWTNSGKSGYNGLQLVLRRPVTNGWGFDFNYTWSHSLDNVSGAESDGAGVQDAFNPDGYRGPSTFDIRHNVTANAVVELPFGHNKHFLKAMPRWADAVIGGWQVSLLGTLRTGTPVNISNAGLYPTNYLTSAIGILRPAPPCPPITCTPTKRASRASSPRRRRYRPSKARIPARSAPAASCASPARSTSTPPSARASACRSKAIASACAARPSTSSTTSTSTRRT